ncbi:MAG TPA: helix-turn-helix domain-containing protein [Bryobacteraceae bacterium]|nr:helix-turn-helix domain-containing protein [Bryobacteraceae bacterium]
MVLGADVTQAQIERILQNKTLRLSEVQRRLLTYLAERSLAGQADDLKEYVIGIDAFGKPSSYDPRQESVVRMHVARLRQKLAEYYRTEGAADPIIVDVPKGGFKITFEPRPAPAASVVEKPRSRWIRKEVWAAGIMVLLAGVAYLAAYSPKPQPAIVEASPWSPDLQQLWTPLLSPTRPLVVCIANPTFGMASGAFRLGQFLGSRKPDLLVTQGEQLSMPEVAMNNIVFLGPTTGNRQAQSLPGNQQIVLEANGIRNLRPLAGELAFVSDRTAADGKGVEESYALISHLPGLYGNGDFLYLSGNRAASVMAAVKVFTDPMLAGALVRSLKTPAGIIPRYYQAVLRVRSMDEMPVDVSTVLHRDLSFVPNPPAKP